jgi:formate dehydrogenase subunit gamma
MKDPGGTVLRFTLNERLQHLALMICVILLVITGLSLRFADTWLGRAIISLEGGIEARGLLHRAGAIGLILLSAYHFLYVVFTERGHGQLMAIRPTGRDFHDLLATMKMNLGMNSAVPRFDRFDFRQKFQYWAVGLGVLSMVFTGLVLWFESPSMAVLPKWVFDLTQVIHSSEGLLIFVVLFLWHIYDAHLRPGVFPMDRTWLTGRLTRKELQERHPREYERLFDTEEEEVEK